jgi:hypothetical protein
MLIVPTHIILETPATTISYSHELNSLKNLPYMPCHPLGMNYPPLSNFMPTELHLGGLLKPTYWKRYKMPNLIPRPSSMPQSTLNNSYSVCRAPASQPAATDDPPPFSTLPLPPPHPLRGVGRLVPHIYSPYIVWLCFQGLSCKQQLLLLTDCPLPLNHTVFIITYLYSQI